MRKIEEINYSLICTNCTKQCNYTLLNMSYNCSNGVETWKCTNFVPSIIYDRETLRNQVFVEEKQIDKYFERLRRKRNADSL